MQKQRFDWIVVFLFLFSFALRLSLISQGPYHLDCLNLSIQAEKTLDTLKLHYMFGPGYPLTVLFGSFFIWLARLFNITDPVIAVNFMSVVFGSLCVPTIYIIGKRLFNVSAGLFSALFLCFLPIFLALSTYGKSHTPSLFLLLVCVYYLLKFCDSKTTKYLLIAALFAGLMGSTRFQDLILVSPALMFLILLGYQTKTDQEKTRHFKSLIIFGLITFGIVVFFHIPIILKSVAQYQGQAQHFWTIGVKNNFRGLFSTSLWIVYYMTISNFMSGGILSAIAGLILLLFKRPKTATFLLLWTIIPLLFYGNLTTSITRFFVISYIPLILSLGYIFAAISKIGKVARYAIIAFFCLILILMFKGIYPILKFRHTHNPLPEHCLWIKEQTPENAVIISADDGSFIQHYASRKTIYQLFKYHGVLSEREFLEWANELHKNYFSQNIPVYLTTPGLAGNNKDGVFEKFLNKYFELNYIGAKLSHNWHLGGTFNTVGHSTLWKLTPK